MNKKSIFIDTYGVTEVHKLHTLAFCPETFLESRKELHHLTKLPLTNKSKKLIKENLNTKHLPIITDVNSYGKVIFGDDPISILRKLEEIYDLFFLSTPFRDFPITFPEANQWFEKRKKISFADRLLLSYRSDLTIDYYVQYSTSFTANECFKGLVILFEEEEFYTIRDFFK